VIDRLRTRALALLAHGMPALLGGWAITRALLVLQLLIWGDDYLGDVRLYGTWSLLLEHRQFPVGDPYWQYPPGAGPLFAVTGLGNPVIMFVIVALLADLMLLLTLGRGRLQAGWAWVIAGLLVGPLLLSRFDVFPTALAVLAIALAARPVRSGIAAGIGALLKAWPILMLATLRRRSLPAGALAAVLTVALGAWATSAWATGAFSFLGGQGARGLQIESVGALPYLLAGLVGIEQDIAVRYGAFEVTMPGVNAVGLALTAVAGLILLAIVIARLLGRLESVPPADVALPLILVSVATSRVFSPQYDIWIAGIAAACLLDPRTALRPVLRILFVMFALTQVLFPWVYGSLVQVQWHAVLLQTARISLLIIATVMSLANLVRQSTRPTPLK